MALKKNFYNEIFEQEQKWIEFIDNNLLNSIYCDLSLKPFYTKKRNELEIEYKSNRNIILGQVLILIDNIINQIDLLNEEYKKLNSVDIKTLMPLFLINQMNNISQKEEINSKIR